MRKETKILIRTFIALAFLTLATAGISLIKLGVGNFIIAMLIACTKVTLVALFFMNLHGSKILTKIFAMGGLFWLLTLIFLTFNDYISRLWMSQLSIWMH